MLIRPVRKLLSRFMSMRVFGCLAVFLVDNSVSCYYTKANLTIILIDSIHITVPPSNKYITPYFEVLFTLDVSHLRFCFF